MRRIVFLFPVLFSVMLVQGQGISETLLRAKALTERKESAQAILLLTNAIQKTADYRLFVLRADAYFTAGNNAAAISDLTSASKMKPGSGDYSLARIYALRGDVKLALIHLEQSMKTEFRKPEKDIMLDPAFSIIENTPGWRSFWKTDHYTVPEERLSEIGFLTSAGKSAEARSVLSELKTSWPNDDKTLLSKALIDFSEKKYTEAVTELTDIISRDADNMELQKLLVKFQIESGNFAGALDAINRIFEYGTDDASLLLKKALCLKKTGTPEKALDEYNRFLSLYPGDRSALSQAGRTYAETGDNLKAIELFNENIRLHPGDAGCYADRANAFFNSRSWGNAINDYAQALDLNPGDPEVWLSKGTALINAGKTEDACFDLRKALNLGNKKAAPLVSRYCIK